MNGKAALSNSKMESLGLAPMPSLEEAIGLYMLARGRRIQSQPPSPAPAAGGVPHS